jgi:hypothetical protein
MPIQHAVPGLVRKAGRSVTATDRGNCRDVVIGQGRNKEKGAAG